MDRTTILWQGLYWQGHEAARLVENAKEQRIEGTAVFANEGQPCRLDYQIQIDRGWRTRHVQVNGWVGAEPVNLEIVVDEAQTWALNGEVIDAVQGCIDIDLNFSPVTNLLPIRRYTLAIGEEAAVTAAWLRFPTFRLEPLDQTYRRIDTQHYHYASAGGSFTAELMVNEHGFVTDYPGLWQLVR